MTDFDVRLSQLSARLEKMVEYQEYFYREIALLRDEIKSLKSFSANSKAEEPRDRFAEKSVKNQSASFAPRDSIKTIAQLQSVTANMPAALPAAAANEKSTLEEFVGRNLISIVGIIITIIGVAIGAKYAIDNDLISPVMRILAGYLFGAALFGTAVWLKAKYHNFSAVLLSGALAILYFITYFAHSFYALMPQTLAFALMLLATIVTVGAAINYNRQVIAHIGLVGAYAVPFLISSDAGNARILFAYMAIVNFGVLMVSLKKYWKSLFYTSFGFTWLIYAAWSLASYRPTADFALAVSFLTVFFLTFYATFVAYKLFAKEEFGAENVFLLLANSFVFYGLGSALIAGQPGGSGLIGFFTLANAALHFIVAAIAKKYVLGDRRNLNLLAALGLIFTTLAVPVQLSGHLVTLVWAAQAAILFFVGRSRRVPLCEYFAYPLMILAALSLLKDWNVQFFINGSDSVTPFLNPGFVTAVAFVAAFVLIYYVYKTNQTAVEHSFDLIARYALPAIISLVLYNAFRIEINNYFAFELTRTATDLADGSRASNNDLNLFNFIWQLNYTMFFLATLLVVNVRKIKSDVTGFITLGLCAAVLLIFLTGGLFVLDQLRASYFAPVETGVFSRSSFHLIIRYVSFLFVAGMIAAAYKYIAESLDNRFSGLKLKLAFDFVFYVSLLWILSHELLNWAAILRILDADKLGLSVLWGIYALVLVVIGIVQRKKHLRIGAIVLFAFTLVKLFFYDIAALGTISRTVIFVSLGVLLLIISFLYNKYKHLIFDESATAAQPKN